MGIQTRLSTDLCRAFRDAPDPAGLFLSQGHRTVLQSLIDAVALKRAIVLIRGASGSGKTMLVQALIARLGNRSSLKIVALSGGRDLTRGLQEIAGQTDPAGGSELLLLIDDLPGLSGPEIDQIIALRQACHPTPMRSIVLLAKDETTAIPPALAGMLSDQIHLPPLTVDEVPAYLAHRLVGAGCLQAGDELPFSPDAARALHDLSGGVPRFIDYFAERALFEAARDGRAAVDTDLLRASLLDMDFTEIAAGEEEPWRAPDKPVAPPPTSERAVPLMAEARVVEPARPRRWGWLWFPGLAVAFAGLWFAGVGPQPPVTPPPVTQPPAPSPVVEAATVTEQSAPATAFVPVATVLQDPDPDAFLRQALIGQPDRAAIAYERAALLGNPRAAHFLGQIYEAGLGVPQDLQRAQAWYSLALGIKAAEARLRELAEVVAVPAAVAAPIPARHDLFADGQTVLHWRNGPGAAPSRYEVQYQGAHDPQPRATQTTLSAMLLPMPVMRWRVVSLDAQGRRSATSGWAYPDPGGR